MPPAQAQALLAHALAGHALPRRRQTQLAEYVVVRFAGLESFAVQAAAKIQQLRKLVIALVEGEEPDEAALLEAFDPAKHGARAVAAKKPSVAKVSKKEAAARVMMFEAKVARWKEATVKRRRVAVEKTTGERTSAALEGPHASSLDLEEQLEVACRDAMGVQTI